MQEQLKTQASEVLRTCELLQMLSKKKLSAKDLPWLQPELTPKNQGEGIALREATRFASTVPTRAGALLAASGSPSAEMPMDAATQAQLQSEWQDISAKLAKLDFEAARRQAEIDTVKQTVAKLEATVPMAQTREADFKRLVGEGFISSHATQDKTREWVELERDLTVQRARLLEAQSALNETQQAKAAYKSETLRLLGERHAQASTKYSQLQLDAPKASQKEKQTQLTAPVAGIFQQLAIHSVGGVVTSAQPLMIVVPDGPTVTAEITIATGTSALFLRGRWPKSSWRPFRTPSTVPCRQEWTW